MYAAYSEDRHLGVPANHCKPLHTIANCRMQLIPTTILAFLYFIVPVPGTMAWGKIGHQMVANLAWRRLSNETQATINKILIREDGTYGDDDDAGSPLASVANWADKVRFTHYYHWSTPLHYVDVQDTSIHGGCPCKKPGEVSDCNFWYERDCVGDMCAVGAIANYSTRLLEDSQPIISSTVQEYNLAREDIEFLTHMVGDIHQPLHSSRASDKGGNTFHVTFKPQMDHSFIDRYGYAHEGVWNLHSVWDNGIIERAMHDFFDNSREMFELDLTNIIEMAKGTGDLDHWLACADGHDKKCASSWAEESFDDALTWAYRNSDDEEVVNGSVLDDCYYETRVPVVKRKIAAAGVRLAYTLEVVLANKSASWLSTW